MYCQLLYVNTKPILLKTQISKQKTDDFNVKIDILCIAKKNINSCSNSGTILVVSYNVNIIRCSKHNIRRNYSCIKK